MADTPTVPPAPESGSENKPGWRPPPPPSAKSEVGSPPAAEPAKSRPLWLTGLLGVAVLVLAVSLVLVWNRPAHRKDVSTSGQTTGQPAHVEKSLAANIADKPTSGSSQSSLKDQAGSQGAGEKHQNNTRQRDAAALEILQKAMTTHGGEENIEKLQSRYLKVVMSGRRQTAVSIESIAEWPTRERVTFTQTGETIVIDGDHVWMSDSSASSPDEVKVFRNRLFWSEPLLVTLRALRDHSVNLTFLGDSAIQGRTVSGIKAENTPAGEVNVYFDKASNLLVKMAFPVASSEGKVVLHEAVFSDFRTFAGVVYPGKQQSTLDGEASDALEVLAVEFLPKIDSTVFAKPKPPQVTAEQIVKRSQQVDSQWGQVQNIYQRRADLVPNLVQTVSGAAKLQESAIAEIVRARASVAQLNINPIQAPNTSAELETYQQTQEQLGSALGRLLAVAEEYPELKANANFVNLQFQFKNTEDRILVERGRFNEAVRQYNTAVKHFPGAQSGGGRAFQEKPYFTAREAAEAPPKAELNSNK